MAQSASNDEMAKGGNVIRIMCTPEGHVCHATTTWVDSLEANGRSLFGRIEGKLVAIVYFEGQKIEIEGKPK